MAIFCVKEVEQNSVPKSQTKPFYIGTKEAPSDMCQNDGIEGSWRLEILDIENIPHGQKKILSRKKIF